MRRQPLPAVAPETSLIRAGGFALLSAQCLPAAQGSIVPLSRVVMLYICKFEQVAAPLQQVE